MKTEAGNGVVSGYSEALKCEVVKAVQGGMSYNAACVKYGVKAASTVHGWVRSGRGAKRVRKFKRGQVKESELVVRLNREKRELELALSRMSLKVYCLETVIEEASKHYQEDLKKSLSSSYNASLPRVD